jgi:hypothetical protein
VIDYLEAKGCLYSISVKQHKPIAERIASIPESAWQAVPDYPETGICELAEITYGARRLIVRRVHLHAQDEQTELFAYWRHFAFLTNREEARSSWRSATSRTRPSCTSPPEALPPMPPGR